MLNDDQFMERTPDLIAKVRAMREAAEKTMNRFTRLADYDVLHVVGQKPTSATTTVSQSPATQSAIAFPPPPAAASNDSEGE